VRLFFRKRLVLHAAGNDEQLPWIEAHGSITQTDLEASGQHEEEIIVSSCLCQTNSPRTFTTMMSKSFNRATVRGFQWSENSASFSARLTAIACGFLISMGLITARRETLLPL
jgi:hypothetical protein